MVVKVAVVGASGKLGRVISAVIDEEDDFEVVARLGSTSDLDDMLPADVVVDVTVPGVSQGIVDHAVRAGKKVLIGTSGWSADRVAGLERVVAETPGAAVIVIPNFSIGSVLATTFATMAARYFDSIEIVEAHAASKIDSPSGTAVRTAELIAAARSHLGPVSAPHTDQRARGQQVASVPVHSLRLSGVVAKQDVVFGGTGEVLTLTHETISPSAYQTGIRIALRAVAAAEGVTVGLDRLIGLTTAPAAPRAGGTAPENVSGQAAEATTVDR
ncbi:4-hydroxy-tetrahydrodipicolinate reductase [Cnuibacter physcomitrellae]|uniref:4-hydroxy-tetrahydrodipicolinate reductase n=1 Tax=Cnuibacter physcomitrellae TaxID=1619308 RepID=UPI002877E5B8|nr:4-hydroxy-tetrahydrodipicolinate reductase [Cnuibacter physcomitrellae]